MPLQIYIFAIVNSVCPPKPTYSAVNSASPLKVEVWAQNVAKNVFSL